MKVVFYKKSLIADNLFNVLNKNLQYRIKTYNEIACFLNNTSVVGIIAINYAEYEAWLDIYAPKFQLTRKAIRDFCNYIFDKKIRMSCIIAENNKKSQNFVERIGFIKEGELRKQFDGVQNAIYYGFLKDDFGLSKWS